MKHRASLLILIVFYMVCFSQVDTLLSEKYSLVESADTTALMVSADSVITPSQAPVPTTSITRDTTKSSLQISKKKYNHKEQIVFATIMMIFIAVVISSAQNWNPD